MEYIMERVKKSIEKFPYYTAIMYQNTAITYAEMGNFVDAVCNEIMQKFGANAYGKSVLVYMTPSIESIVVQLAVIKCGAIYVPLDTNTPLNVINIGKINDIVGLITNDDKITYYNSYNVICIQKIYNYTIDSTGSDIAHFAYSHCILTSGTTGTPKAVRLKQKSIINQVDAKIKVLNLNSKSRICLSLNISFVASIWQILSMFFIGGTLIVLDDQIRKNPFLMFKATQEFRATVVCTIPSVIRAFLAIIKNKNRKIELNHLKRLVLTGEMLDCSIVNDFYREYDIAIVNAYGQTECSDDIFHHTLYNSISESVVPIGDPIENVRFAIIDEDGNSVKCGVRGELCVSGVCLSDGYVNDEELTNKHFKTLNALNGELAFCTGDIVTQLKNGNVVCHGRKDNQIKIRGFRIEPESIEFICDQYPGIADSLVLKEKSEINTFLHLFYVVKPEHYVDETKLRQYLQRKLPSYMIPAKYTLIDKIIYNSHGKKIRR